MEALLLPGAAESAGAAAAAALYVFTVACNVALLAALLGAGAAAWIEAQGAEIGASGAVGRREGGAGVQWVQGARRRARDGVGRGGSGGGCGGA